MRSITLTLTILFLTTGCGTLDPLTESPFKDSEEVGCDTGTEDSGGEVETETDSDDSAGDTAIEETAEPCTVNMQWNVENSIVQVDAFSLPRLDVSTTCASSVTINQVELYFSGERWIEELTDTRLGVGTEYEHFGVYSPLEMKCQQERCGMMWEIDPTSFSSAYPTSTSNVSFGFSLAGFYNDDLAEIDGLWDELDDEVILTAVVDYTVDDITDDVVAQTTIMITAQ